MTARTPRPTVCSRLSGHRESLAPTPLTQSRYTPYEKSNQRSRVLTGTPLPRRQQKARRPTEEQKSLSHQLSRRDNAVGDSNESLSSVVVGKTWKVYRVSPLYRLKLDRKSFKLYERQLNAWLMAECNDRNETEVRRTTFRKVDGESDGEYAVEIKVFSESGKENGKNGTPELVTVLYCGGNNGQGFERLTPDQTNIKMSSFLNGGSELTSLPLCLIKSPVLLKECFLKWLEGQFGCMVSPLLFSPIDLAWLVSLCSGIGDPSHSTELTYKVPAVAQGLDTICFSIVARDAKMIWDSVHDSQNEVFTNEEALKFLTSLETHFYHHFKIHLDKMQLVTIGTSVAYVGREGRAKIFQRKYACYILQQFLQMARF